MGIIKRQGFSSAIYSYIGVVIGFVNKILIFTHFLSTEELGLANILITLAMVLAQFSALGIGTTTLRFFPFFRNSELRHHGFLFWVIIIPVSGFLLFSSLALLLRPQIISIWIDESPLLAEYYPYAIPIGFSVLLFFILEVYLRSLFQTVIQAFLKQIVQRLMVTTAALTYGLGYIDFPEFVALYATLYSSVSIILLIYTIAIGEFHFKPKISWRLRKLSKKIMVFALFNLLSGATVTLIMHIDALMLSWLKGLGDVGIYTTSFYITTLMLLPWRSIHEIASPIVAEHWKNRNMKGLSSLYKTASLVNLIIGGLLFLGIWGNRKNIFAMMPQEYEAGVWVILFLCIARLFDMFTSLNGTILNTSKRFRYDLMFSVFLLILTVTTNYLFIPRYGIDGAAFATMSTLIFYNSFRMLFVWYFFGLHPFQSRLIWVLLIFGVTLPVDFLLPRIEPFYLDIVVRSSLITLIYGSLTLGLKVSPDVNKFSRDLLNRVLKLLRTGKRL